MTDEEYRDLVNKHDKHIDIMATSIEHLASAVGTTNSKLETVIEVIGKQNLLAEKFMNLESNLKESFARVHSKIKDLEDTQKGVGCTPVVLISEKVIVANKRIADLEDALKWIVRLMMGTVVVSILGLVLHT